MRSQRFEVEHRSACLSECAQRRAFPRACHAAHHAPLEAPRQRVEIGHDRTSICLVTAIEATHAPADLREHVRERLTASTATTAVDEWLPVPRPVLKALAQMARDV